jgi:hypothetical protein
MANPLNSGRSLLCPAILVFFLMAGPVFCQTTLSNEQLLTDAVDRALSGFLDSLAVTPGSFLVSSATGLDEIAGEGAKSAFLQAGWTINSPTDSTSGSMVNASIRFSAYQFGYTKGRSRGFWKRPFIKRTLACQVAIGISGRFNYVGFRDIIYNDQILYGQANNVASPRYNQLAPEVPRLGASRFVEPVAVAATVGGLIYLFFASR